MRCRFCNKQAVIRIKAYNTSFCGGCFIRFFRERVEKTIVKYHLFDYNNKILVAVSGGKDSLAVWDVLINLNYNTEGLYIDLGIDGYSQDSETEVKQFATRRGVKYTVTRVKDILGLGIAGAAKKTRRPICSICGMVKRYLMNQEAQKIGAEVIVTGHNLDDEAATLFGNFLNWQTGYLDRQSPKLSTQDGLVARAKPLVLISERESATYASLNKIDYQIEQCPHSHGATSIFYKQILNRIESKQPATKLRFYKGFLRYWKKSSPPEELNPCTECGYPTTAGICSFCRLKKRIADRD